MILMKKVTYLRGVFTQKLVNDSIARAENGWP